MIYHLKPVLRYRKLEPPYEGLHLGTHRIRLTQRFAAWLAGVLRAQVSYDTGARVGALIHCTARFIPSCPEGNTALSSRRQQDISASMIRQNQQGNRRGDRELTKERKKPQAGCLGHPASCFDKA